MWRAQRSSNGDLNEYPPLHRHLIPPETHSDDDEVTHGSDPDRKDWDNGAQSLLHELGYYRSDQDRPSHYYGDEDEEDYGEGEEEEGLGPLEFESSPQARPSAGEHLRESVHRSDRKSRNSFRPQIQPRDRRVTKVEDQRLRIVSAIRIQSVIRRHLAKRLCSQRRAEVKEKEKKLLEEQEVAAAASQARLRTVVKTQSSVLQSLKSFSLGDNLRSLSRGLSSPISPAAGGGSQKPLLRVLSKEFVHAVDQSVQAMKVASDSVVTKYQEKTEQLKETKVKNQLETFRKERLEANEFCVEDAVFNVRGRPTDLPRLNRLWYLGVFPQLDEYEMDEETAAGAGALNTGEMLSGHDLEQAYEMIHDRLIGEAVRTPPLTPFSKETYQKLNFNLHLADLQRYTRLLVVVFVETSEELDGRIRTDVLPNHIAIPSVKKTKSRQLLAPETPKFLPLFYGSCQLNGGLAFSPCGGRLLFHLQPNPNQAIIFSKSQAKRLSAIKHIELQGTLIPVAIPSSRFLTSLTDPKSMVLPHYPGELLDAFLFEKNEVQVKEFYGAAVCMLRFHSRNLISTRHRGVPNGIVEFSTDGKYLGKVIEYREDLGTISTMSCGKYYFICCGSTGAIAVYGPKESSSLEGTGSQEFSLPTSTPSPTEPFELLRFQSLHQWPILLSCCIHRAGLDFFFTVDRQNAVGVLIMDRQHKTCLRSYLNHSFVSAKITSCQPIRDRLYVGLQNGYLLTINIAPLLNGQLDCGKRLEEYVLDRESIYPEDCGISTLTVMSSAEYFGLLHEDLDHHQHQQQPSGNFTSTNVRIKPRPRLIGMKLKPAQRATGDDQTIYQKNSRLKPGRPLEGHILLIAGGDAIPTIKILHPIHPKPATGSAFYQIGELPGHGKAVTHMACDVAGRFIVTSSQGSKSIAIWNGVTFNCERTHENVNVGYLGVGENSLFACSFKAPFVTIWKPPEAELGQDGGQKKAKRGGRKRRPVEPSRSNLSDLFNLSSVIDEEGDLEWQREGEEMEGEGDPEMSRDGRPEIAMVRTSVWCLTTVTGGKMIPQKSLSATTRQYLGDNGRRVVTDWHSCYNRSIKKIAKPPPPKRLQSSPFKKSSSLPPIQEKAKRKELQRLASGGGGGVGAGDSISSWNQSSPWEGGRGDDLEDEMGSLSQPTYETTLGSHLDHSMAQQSSATGADDWRSGYDYQRGCYYDENGYAYNYDQQGNYFYYDAAWYDQHPYRASPSPSYQPSSASVSATPQSPQTPYATNSSPHRHQIEDPMGSTMTSESFPAVETFPSFPSQEERDEQLQIGEHSFQSPRSSHQLLPPVDHPTTMTTVAPVMPGGEELKPKKIFHQDPEDYDRYGKYIGSDLDRYDDDLPPSSSIHHRSVATAEAGGGGSGVGGSKHSLPVISLKRRHMHMSDSESDEDERLESIFRKKNQKGAREKSPEKSEEEQEEEDESLGEGRGGRGMTWRAEQHSREEEEQEEEEEEEGGESVVSVSKEKLKYLEREKYIQRGLLHHLADDSEDED